MTDILVKLAKECQDVNFIKESDTVEIKGINYNIRDLKYVVEKNGAERIVKSSMIPFRRIVVYTVKGIQN